jgi:hypothetical protein
MIRTERIEESLGMLKKIKLGKGTCFEGQKKPWSTGPGPGKRSVPDINEKEAVHFIS